MDTQIVKANRLRQSLAVATTPDAANLVAIQGHHIAAALLAAGATLKEANEYARVASEAAWGAGKLLGPGKKGHPSGKVPNDDASSIGTLNTNRRRHLRSYARVKKREREVIENQIEKAGIDLISINGVMRLWRERQREKRHKLSRAEAAVIDAKKAIVVKAVNEIVEHDLASETVAAVITDPPYPEKDLKVHAELGQFAMRVLKPGGWCLVLAGTMYLPQILQDLPASGLLYRGMLIARFPGGPNGRIGSLKLFQSWKPIIVLQKPPKTAPAEWHRDEIVVPVGEDKHSHDWQQPESLFRELITRFTKPDDLVADPFAGTGTTLRAAQSTGRHGWGCDDGSADHFRKGT